MDGLELTRQIMAKYPRPILVISNAVQSTDTDNIFQLLQAGAVDVFPKPTTGLPSDYEKIKGELINTIKVLSGVRVFTKPIKEPQFSTIPELATVTPTQFSPTMVESIRALKSRFKVLAIGSSTGGPSALEKILWSLPAHFPMPVICGQHISEGFLEGLTNWLDSHCQLKVKIAQIGKQPQPGHVYFAPETQHLELDTRGRFIYVPATSDESTSVIFGMPKEAIALGAAQYVLPLQDIAPFLNQKLLNEVKDQ